MKQTESAVFPPVVCEVEVPGGPNQAFQVFTSEISSWWPLSSHSVLGSQARSCVFESGIGGRLYEIGADGQTEVWGRIRLWDPPNRVVFSWHPGRAPETAQEVEVQFVARGAKTRVKLEHRNWEAFGAGAREMREGYSQGWAKVLGQHFVSALARPGNQPAT